MPGLTFRLDGGRALEGALSDMKRATAKSVGRRTLKRAADPILADYRANTTVASGELQESEVVGTKLNRRQSRLNRKNASKSAVEVHIGTSDQAGIQEEFGNIHQVAHPALRPAWDAHGGQVATDAIGRELATEIEKTAARARRRAGG